VSENNENDKPTLNPEASEPGVIALPETAADRRKMSPIILPDSFAGEVLPGSSFDRKLKLENKTLADIGVTSEDDLADDISLERSSLDGACVVVAIKDQMPVCQYCFLPFVIGVPEYEPAEIQVAKPDGSEQGVRVKIHGSCHIKRMRELQEKKAQH
jgi:hypothetical protein